MKVETKTGISAPAKAAGATGAKHPFLWIALLLAIILAFLFRQSFHTGYVAYSNDGPYGLQAAECNLMPSTLSGMWSDLGWLGNEGISPSPDVTSALLFTFPLHVYMNLFYPVSLFIVGICACFCLRQFKLAPLACILGGLAAALNSDFLSTTVWGVAPQIISFGANYLALGLLAGMSGRRAWVRVVLAGLAVGLGVMEGFDNGAIFSLFVAAFALFQALFLQEGSTAQKFGRGILRIAVVALFAGFIAVHTLSLLVGTQIKGVAAAQQDEQTKAARWSEATEWSLPPVETLQTMVPGLFGYRNVWHMYENNQPKDDQYWGSIGADPSHGMWRLVGTGFYGGVLVVVLALWAILQSFRGRGSPYSEFQRRLIWFWTGVLVVALLLAFGKFGPLYRLFYALPYASTIRNPVKFMHVFSWALVILFGFGVHGLTVAYLENPVARAQGWFAQFKKWRAGAAPFERKWMNACFAAIGVSLLGWFIYASKSSALEAYLQTVAISASDAPGIAKFSLQAVGWFILFLVLTVGLLALIFSGQFAGPRAKWAGILLGILLVVDLGRADRSWIVYYDANYKFASDPIINFLADKPYEHRVMMAMRPEEVTNMQRALLHNAYSSHWLQHVFPYHNIQSLEVIQEPRVAVDKERFMRAVPAQIYVLSSIHYFLGAADFAKKNDPTGQHLRVLKTFNFVPKRPDPTSEPVDWKTVEDPNGELAVIEYMDALPRAKLYSNWQVNTNDDETLQIIGSQGFNPHQTVLVANPISAPATANAGQPAGTVEINPNYKSKRVELQADVKVPSVLLLTERYNPQWRVEVDDKPAALLRCNFVERGVYLEPGKHKVVFRFVPSMTTFYTSLAGVFLGLVLSGWLAFDKSGREPDATASAVDASKSKPNKE